MALDGSIEPFIDFSTSYNSRNFVLRNDPLQIISVKKPQDYKNTNIPIVMVDMETKGETIVCTLETAYNKDTSIVLSMLTNDLLVILHGEGIKIIDLADENKHSQRLFYYGDYYYNCKELVSISLEDLCPVEELPIKPDKDYSRDLIELPGGKEMVVKVQTFIIKIAFEDDYKTITRTCSYDLGQNDYAGMYHLQERNSLLVGSDDLGVLELDLEDLTEKSRLKDIHASGFYHDRKHNRLWCSNGNVMHIYDLKS